RTRCSLPVRKNSRGPRRSSKPTSRRPGRAEVRSGCGIGSWTRSTIDGRSGRWTERASERPRLFRATRLFEPQCPLEAVGDVPASLLRLPIVGPQIVSETGMAASVDDGFGPLPRGQGAKIRVSLFRHEDVDILA